MTLRDKFRFLLAKIFLKKIILFSKKYDWEPSIKKNLKGSSVFFYEFNEVDPNAFDIVVPLSLHAQKYINNNPALLAPQKALIPSNYCIDLCDDKKLFHDFLLDNGLGTFAPKVDGDFVFPYILKRKIGAWGVDIYIIHDSKDERENLDKIQSSKYFKQEYIRGREEYTAHIVIIDNNIVFFKALEFMFSANYFVKGKHYKPTTVTEVDHSQFKQTFQNILLKIGYQGICCFNYKIVNQDLMIFEVNPRYGGTMTRFIKEALLSYEDAINITPISKIASGV